MSRVIALVSSIAVVGAGFGIAMATMPSGSATGHHTSLEGAAYSSNTPHPGYSQMPTADKIEPGGGELTKSDTLGNARTTCSASDLTLGQPTPQSGEGNAYFAEVFLHQLIRNTGPACRLMMPDHLAFTTDRQADAPVFVDVVGRAWYRMPHGASRLLSIGVSYPPFGQRVPYCPHPLTDPTAVSVPLGSSSLTIDVAGLWKQRSIWPQVCRGPKPPAGSYLTRVPTITLSRVG